MKKQTELKEFLSKEGMTAAEFSEKSKTPLSTIFNYTCGRNPLPGSMSALMDEMIENKKLKKILKANRIDYSSIIK